MQQLDAYSGIDAPPDKVWAVITDLASFPEWNPFIVRAAQAFLYADRFVPWSTIRVASLYNCTRKEGIRHSVGAADPPPDVMKGLPSCSESGTPSLFAKGASQI